MDDVCCEIESNEKEIAWIEDYNQLNFLKQRTIVKILEN